MGMVPEAVVERWGRVPYLDAMARQEHLYERRLSGAAADTIVSLEHPPTITLGRHAPLEDAMESARSTPGESAVVVRSDRGGRATYHGPGQAILYPIVGIADRGLGVRDWVRLLEGVIVDVLSSFGISGRCRAGAPGVWTARGKIGSIGLRVRRGISTHGIAVNVDLDVAPFAGIVTCGVRGEAVTTIAVERQKPTAVTEVSELLCRTLLERLPSSARP